MRQRAPRLRDQYHFSINKHKKTEKNNVKIYVIFYASITVFRIYRGSIGQSACVP